MRALVIHEMYEVLRRHSATVRFQHGAPPDIIGTTHISPPQCVKPPAIPRFVPSFFTRARDLRAQIHLPCRRASVYRFSIRAASSPPRRDPPASRRLYIASGKILRRIRRAGAPIERRIDPRVAAGVRQSKRRGKYWPTIFYLFRRSERPRASASRADA